MNAVPGLASSGSGGLVGPPHCKDCDVRLICLASRPKAPGGPVRARWGFRSARGHQRLGRWSNARSALGRGCGCSCRRGELSPSASDRRPR